MAGGPSFPHIPCSFPGNTAETEHSSEKQGAAQSSELVNSLIPVSDFTVTMPTTGSPDKQPRSDPKGSSNLFT